MKKVLIITYFFPPVSIISSKRYGNIAPFMPEFGWQPIILTTNAKGDMPVLIPENDIIRIGKNYHINKTLVADEGYKGIPGILRPFYYLYKKQNIEIKSIDRFLFSWGKEVLSQKKIINEINPDAIISTYLPAVSVWLGYILSRELKKPWLVDFRDACSLYNVSKSPIVRFLDRTIDKFLIKRADAVITVGDNLAEVMEKFYKRPIETVYHGFDVSTDSATKASDKIFFEKGKIIYYAGRFHTHRIKAVKLLIDWLAGEKNNNYFFVIRSLGPKESNEEILKYAKEKNALSKIKLLAPASPGIIGEEEKSADVLVLFEDLEKELGAISKGTMPGKFFEYFSLPPPILIINRQDSDLGVILRKTGRGYLASSLKELDDAIKKISNGEFSAFDHEKFKQYSRREQAKKICSILDKIK